MKRRSPSQAQLNALARGRAIRAAKNTIQRGGAGAARAAMNVAEERVHIPDVPEERAVYDSSESTDFLSGLRHDGDSMLKKLINANEEYIDRLERSVADIAAVLDGPETSAPRTDFLNAYTTTKAYLHAAYDVRKSLQQSLISIRTGDEERFSLYSVLLQEPFNSSNWASVKVAFLLLEEEIQQLRRKIDKA